MVFFRSVIVAMGMQFWVCEQLGHTKSTESNNTSISCNDIRAEHPPGFTFLYDCSPGNEVFVYHNQTVIAHAKFKEKYYNWLPVVKSIDNSSVVTTECRNLKIQCYIYNGPLLNEIWRVFEVTETSPVPIEGSPTWKLIIGLSVLLIIMLIIGIPCCYWRKAITSRFAGSCCCCQRDEGCQLSCPSRCHKDDGSQVSTTGDVATPPDDMTSLTEVVTSEPHGHGENQQDNITGTVQANGKLKDDPGGASAVRTMNQNNGCTHGDCGPEGQRLLDQRAAVHSSGMTAEAVALVNKHDFDPEPVDMCSTALLHETMTRSQTKDKD